MCYNDKEGKYMRKNYYWYTCPVCGNPKMIMMRIDTGVQNLPAYCKKCKTESIITIEPKRQIIKSY